MESVQESLKHLRVDYIDLILIHWPGAKGFKLDDPIHLNLRKTTWKNLESLFNQGLVKSIGVSNYNIRQLNELLEYSTIKPQWLQVTCLFQNNY